MTPAMRAASASAAPAMTPRAFLREMTRLVRARRAAEAAALYDRHGRALAPRLGEFDRETLAALMEYVDTVVGFQPPAAPAAAPRLARNGAEAPADVGEAAAAPGARVPQ